MPCGDTAAFWHLRTSSERDQCNMELSNQVLYANGPRLVAKTAHTGNPLFELPVAINSKAVEKGKELVLFIEKAGDVENTKKKATIEPVLVGKKRKVQ